MDIIEHYYYGQLIELFLISAILNSIAFIVSIDSTSTGSISPMKIIYYYSIVMNFLHTSCNSD